MNNSNSSLMKRTAKRTLRYTNHFVDGLFVLLMLFLLLCSIYIKMDTDSVYEEADPKQWVEYKPDFPEDVISFEELQDKNKDVIGWLTIYGTNIDYPLLYSSESNDFYLNHNALGEHQASGSLFLDYRNSPDFSDFNNIIHGHHMDREKMFGELDKFVDEDYFQKHEFGNIYFGERDHSFQIIATILTNGYDGKIYRTGLADDASKLEFINYVYEKSSLIRGVDLSDKVQAERQRTLLTQGVTSPLTPNDTLLIFSTCNLTETNGRYIVIAKLLDHNVENPFASKEKKKKDNGYIDTFTLFNQYGSLPLWVWIAIIILLIIMTFILYEISRRRDRKKAERNNAPEKETDAYENDE